MSKIIEKLPEAIQDRLSDSEQAESRGEIGTFIKSLVGGLIASIPIVMWMAPRSGRQMRQGIRQQGLLIRRKAGDAVGQVGDQIEQVQQKVRGDSIKDAIEEGKAIAQQRRTQL